MDKKILVVDDEVSILEMAKEVFESAGYTVLTAANAEEALEIIKNQAVWVMFLDIRLPGMSGMELCKIIRRDDRISIIHAFTGYSNLYGLVECRTIGFDDFFVKPVDLDVLLKAAQYSFERLERWQINNFGLTS